MVPEAILGEQECCQSIVSKESVVSADASFRSVCVSLGIADVRRPSSATSYSFGSISSNNLKHANISSVGALAAGESSRDVGSIASGTSGGATAKSHHASQGSRGIPSLSKLRISEENQISVLADDQLQRTNGLLPSQSASPPVSGKLIHPGMEVSKHDIGRPSHDRHLTPPLQSPRYSGPKVVSSFDPTHAFLITRTGTPGWPRHIGDRHKHHILRSRGWEIRDVSGAIRRGPNVSTKVQRAGTGGVGGKNATAELALENVTEEVFGTWGCWEDIGSHIPWRRSLDSSILPNTPSTSSFFSHIRTPILQKPPPHSPSLAASSIIIRPSVDSRAGSLPGPLQVPPDPAYVSLKTNAASSKSTFYSIETGPVISGHLKFPEAYQSETSRIPISQWKVPYSINSPSTITLLNFSDSHYNKQHGHKSRPQKSKKVEVWAEASDLRTQFFEMDKSTYTWEFRVLPKMKIPISTDSTPSHSLFASPTTQTSRIPYPPSPITPATPTSVPSTSIGRDASFLKGRLGFDRGVQKVVKYRSECLVLLKDVDGARYIVGEYYFPKSMKSITVTPVSTTSRLKQFISSPGSSKPTKETNPSQLPRTPSTLESSSPSFRAKEKVHYTNIGGHQSGILLLNTRGVNKVLALNSLLLTLKREKQRKIVTLNASSNGVRTRRWGYGVYDNDLVEEGETKSKGKGREEEHCKREGDNDNSLCIGSTRNSERHDITISICPDEDDVAEGETLRTDRDARLELDVDDYSLQGDDWEYDETEGWKRRGQTVVVSRGGVS